MALQIAQTIHVESPLASQLTTNLVVPLVVIEDPFVAITFSSTSSSSQYHGLVMIVGTDVANI